MKQTNSVTFKELVNLPKCPVCNKSPIVDRSVDKTLYVTGSGDVLKIPLKCPRCKYEYCVHLSLTGIKI